MRLDDLVRISMRQVLRQRRRNIGVLLAIALGTAGFIVVITMSQDVITNLNKDLELLGGATRMKVQFKAMWEDPELSRNEWFRDSTIEAIRAMPKVSGVTVLLEPSDFVSSNLEDRTYPFRLVGVDEYFWNINSFTPASGRFFEPSEVRSREKIIVLGENLAVKLFGTLEVHNRLLAINQDIYRVVGVLGGLGISDRTEWGFVPITTLADRTRGDTRPRRLYVRCSTWDDVESVYREIPAVIAAHQPDQGLFLEVAWKQLEHVKRIFWWVQLFVYVSIVATLVLGGFGIWNVQMISVRARTREIGLKKAMGAEDHDILAQFLTEALCLSLIAALFGIVAGRVGVMVVAFFLKSSPPETLFLLCVGLGLVFSILIGVGAGLYPSIRASRMEVVSAVRYE